MLKYTYLQVLHPVLALVLNARVRLGASFFMLEFVAEAFIIDIKAALAR